MSVTFPRAFPLLGFSSVRFDLELQEVHNPEQSGRLVSVERGPPRWFGEYAIETGDRRTTGIWTAWLRSLKFSRQFLGRDPYRPLPLAYKSGLPGGWNGHATSWTVNLARDEVELNAGASRAGFQYLTGDYLGFSWDTGGKLTLHEILADVAANGSGVAMVPIEPALPTWVDPAAIATVNGPACLMKIVPGSVQSPKDGVSGRISFQARQDLVA